MDPTECTAKGMTRGTGMLCPVAGPLRPFCSRIVAATLFHSLYLKEDYHV